MTAQIIDGKALAANIRASLRPRIEKLAAQGCHPALAVILAGNDPASQVYVRNKIRACADVGIRSIEKRLPESTTEKEILALVEQLNADPEVTGILVQLPLPAGINEDRLIQAIDPAKDVDGFHPENTGRLMSGLPGILPCTPYGAMRMIETTGVDLTGKKALVIGRSNIVGKPMALLLLRANATVTIAHSRTRNLAELARESDVVVAAVGRARMVTGDMIKRGAIVIDVGINRGEDGKLCGDCDTESCSHNAGWITPVPGGAGPMTIAMLMVNTVEAAERQIGLTS